MTHLPKELEELVKKEAEARYPDVKFGDSYNKRPAFTAGASFLYSLTDKLHPPGVQGGARWVRASELPIERNWEYLHLKILPVDGTIPFGGYGQRRDSGMWGDMISGNSYSNNEVEYLDESPSPSDNSANDSPLRELREEVEAANIQILSWKAAYELLDDSAKEYKSEIETLKKEIDGWIMYKQNIDEALNSGDGVYRP